MKFDTRDIGTFANVLQLPLPKSLGVEMGQLLAKVKDGKTLTVEIKVKTKKRSLTANGKCWAICQEIALELSKDGDVYTKEDVYRNAIKEYGVFVVKPIPDELLGDWLKMWQSRGLGWFAEPVRAYSNYTDVACYRGSSDYDTAQMARLIDGLIQDAKSIGLLVMTEAERTLLLEEWEKERGNGNG